MRDVPKIVMKRLQERAAGGAHTDRDPLTAFAERSLGETERVRVIEHLSRCSDCREVVALAALPVSEVAAVIVSVESTSGSWFGWPVLRWIVVAGGIVAIASVGIVQYRQRQKSASLVSSLTSSNQTSATAGVAPSPSPAVPETKEELPSNEKQRPAEIRKKASPSQTDNLFANRLVAPVNPALPRAQAMRGAAVGSASRGARGFTNNGAGVVPKAAPPSSGDTSAVSGNLKNATPPDTEKLAPSLSGGQPSAVPSSAQTVEVESQGEAVTATTDRQGSGKLIENKKQQPLSYESSPTVGVVAAKDAPTAEASGMLRASPRWSIAADGALLGSFDAGNTWVEVNVEMASNRAKAAIAGDTLEYAQKKKSKPRRVASPIFRTVSAQGAEVWAGGSTAMLYHSADYGAHWTRVLPFSSGAALTGDVTSIEFSDSQHGRIITSAGEVWITADDGQSWRRQ